MNNAVPDARLTAAIWECNRHADALTVAMLDWQPGDPPSVEALDQDAAVRRLTDQILYRFTKLQDAMGERLVPTTLAWLQEPQESWPMRDKLDRLEKLGYLDVEAWLQWRDVRNRLAHEYPGTADLRHAAVLAAVAAVAAVAAARLMVQAFGLWHARLSLPLADPG